MDHFAVIFHDAAFLQPFLLCASIRTQFYSHNAKSTKPCCSHSKSWGFSFFFSIHVSLPLPRFDISKTVMMLISVSKEPSVQWAGQLAGQVTRERNNDIPGQCSESRECMAETDATHNQDKKEYKEKTKPNRRTER